MSTGTIFFKPLASGADLSAKVGFAAKISTGTWVLGTENDGLGVIVNGGSASGDLIEVAMGYVPFCKAGGAITTGARISVKATTGDFQAAVSGDTPVGWALSDATADGDEFEAFIIGAADEAVA